MKINEYCSNNVFSGVRIIAPEKAKKMIDRLINKKNSLVVIESLEVIMDTSGIS